MEQIKIDTYITLNSIYQNKVLTDNEIISNLERIGLTSDGNNYRIEKTIQIAVNNLNNLKFDETIKFDKRIKESILSQGQFSKTELNF